MIARLVDQVKLSYGQRLAEIWPEFAAAGEGRDHRRAGAGAPGRPARVRGADGGLGLVRLGADLAASWKRWRRCGGPGQASGYPPGHLRLYRRARSSAASTGGRWGQALREDIAEPLGLDLWIGLPDSEHHRWRRRAPAVPRCRTWATSPNPRRVAFMTPWASPGGKSLAEWRRAEMPSVTGHATAPALAAADGGDGQWRPAGRRTAAKAGDDRGRGGVPRSRPRTWCCPTSWPGAPASCATRGWGSTAPAARVSATPVVGGSCAFADPERGVSGAYVMNRQSAELIADARARRLIEAAYAGL